MAAFDPWTTPSAREGHELAGAIGTRDAAATFMAKVYRWMALGLGVTGAVALMVADSKAQAAAGAASRGAKA